MDWHQEHTQFQTEHTLNNKPSVVIIIVFYLEEYDFRGPTVTFPPGELKLAQIMIKPFSLPISLGMICRRLCPLYT